MMDLELLQFRAQVINHIRNFFLNKEYLELDTPSLSENLIPETCLEVFKTQYIEPGSHKEHELFLAPSPEIYIKKIIAAHKVSVFQISKCYRNIESVGKTHTPEFTMLEYYTMNATYKDSLELTEKLFSFISKLPRDMPNFLKQPFTKITMNEAFKLYAGFYLDECKTSESLAQKARTLDLYENKENPFSTWAWDDLYELIFVHAVEPNLPKDKMTAILNYPSMVPCLAKNADAFHKERWELYGGGIELANCYSEETDANLVKEYFKSEGKLKKERSLVKHTIDEAYSEIFTHFPECSGVALGVDRLLMLLTKRSTIDSVLPFPLKS